MSALPSGHAITFEEDEAHTVMHPRYRTLDGLELELPVHLERFVLVPGTLARSEPDLIWALEYEEVPPLAPQVRDELGGDPLLDFSEGALLVPIERWNARAVVEPALVASRAAGPDHGVSGPVDDPRSAMFEEPVRHARRLKITEAGRRSVRVVTGATSAIATAVRWAINVAALAAALFFAAAAGQWLASLHDGMNGSELGSGALLLVSAMLLSALVSHACSTEPTSASGAGAPAVGGAAHAIFAAGTTLIAVAMTAFPLGLGP